MLETLTWVEATSDENFLGKELHQKWPKQQIIEVTSTEFIRPITILIAYVHKDKRLLVKIEEILITLSRQGWRIAWYRSEVSLGVEWKREDYLDTVDLILLLVSPDFITTEYCYSEQLAHAIKRHMQGALVIPIIFRACLWSRTPFAGLRALPEGGEPINKWASRDAAFQNTAEGIEDALSYLRDRL